MLDPELEWMSGIPFKDDWELLCYNLHTYGRVARVDYILPDAQYDKGVGGSAGWRTTNEAVRQAKIVLAKWPQYVRRNPKRVGEMLLRHNTRTMPKSAQELYIRINH